MRLLLTVGQSNCLSVFSAQYVVMKFRLVRVNLVFLPHFVIIVPISFNIFFLLYQVVQLVLRDTHVQCHSEFTLNHKDLRNTAPISL